MATKKLTPVNRKSKADINIEEEVVSPTTKKTTTKDATSADASPLFTQTEVLEELKKQTEYLHRVDWKLWMLMNMVRIIGEENGYTFRLHQGLSDMDNIKENE
jgi:hypothetical protein